MATATASQRLYEGMFLMAPSAAGVGEAVEQIKSLLERAGAEIVSLSKWDDRKLAYTIRGQKRGTFIHALFRVEGVKIANIERDCNLGDEVTRVLITSGEHLGEVEIELAKEDAGKTRDEAAISRAGSDDDASSDNDGDGESDE